MYRAIIRRALACLVRPVFVVRRIERVRIRDVGVIEAAADGRAVGALSEVRTGIATCKAI